MRSILIIAALAILAVGPIGLLATPMALANGPAFAAESSDSQIKKAIIADSIANYPGNCPCPYNTARNGSHCGKRSAYSKPGGYEPICYDSDVTPEMVSNYRKTHGAN